MTEVLAPWRVTREAYQQLPEGPPYYELIDGKLVEMTRVNEDHNELGCSSLSCGAPRSGSATAVSSPGSRLSTSPASKRSTIRIWSMPAQRRSQSARRAASTALPT